MALMDTLQQWQTENPNLAYAAGVLAGAALIIPVSVAIGNVHERRCQRKLSAATKKTFSPENIAKVVDDAITNIKPADINVTVATE
jgi:hypothetical protein